MKGPLSDVRILDLSRMLSGPFASMMLADLGAEVIKIEDPDGGDKTRTMGPKLSKGQSAYFLSINRNKKSLTLDLRKEKHRKFFTTLLKWRMWFSIISVPECLKDWVVIMRS